MKKKHTKGNGPQGQLRNHYWGKWGREVDGFSIQFNSIFYFSELYNSEKDIHVIQYFKKKG